MIHLIKKLKSQQKYTLIVILLVCFVIGTVLGYQWWQKARNKLSAPRVVSEEYGLFGKNFDELVAGYAVFQKTEGLSELYGYINQTNVYFKITDYTNNEFIESLEKKIAEGNGINLSDNESILFNLGCSKDGEIVADGKNPNYYILGFKLLTQRVG